MRVVVDASGALRTSRTAPGRGAWLCAGSVECAREARRRNGFGRALRRTVAPEAVEAWWAGSFDLLQGDMKDFPVGRASERPAVQTKG
jgi:predicted RNA-binding protein YlxR (DUF448 family)